MDPEKQRQAPELLLTQGRFADCELQVRCQDGSLRDGLFAGAIIENQGQRYSLTAMVDQTERKQAE